MADPIREALERLVSAYDSNEGLPIAEWIAAARAALAAAPPDGPAAGEVGKLVSWLGVVSEQFRLAELNYEATQTDRSATLLEQLSAHGWQPIDTAPKDGTEILASDYDAIEIVSWKTYEAGSDWESRWGEVMFPAWWQPLADHPPLPTPTPAGQEGA